MKRSSVLSNAVATTAKIQRLQEDDKNDSRAPAGYVVVRHAVDPSKGGEKIDMALLQDSQDVVKAKRKQAFNVVSSQGLPPHPTSPPSIESAELYGPHLMYLLDPAYFGVRNPNCELYIYANSRSFNTSFMPARNSWDWDRLSFMTTVAEVRRLIQCFARYKLCQSKSVSPDCDTDFTGCGMPPRWVKDKFWQEVYRGSFENEKGELVALIRPCSVHPQDTKIDCTVMFASFYLHLLRSYSARGTQIAYLPKNTLVPDVAKMPPVRNSAQLKENIKRLQYDTIRRLGDCCLTSRAKVFFNSNKDGSGGASASGKSDDDNISIQLAQMAPYAGCSADLKQKFAVIEVTQRQMFSEPLCVYDNLVLPVSAPLPIRGGIIYRKFDSANKSQETTVSDDFDFPAFNMEELGKPALTLGALSRDPVAVDYAIVLIKMLIESSMSPVSVAGVTSIESNFSYLKAIAKKLTRNFFSGFMPNMEVRIQYPGIFKRGVTGKVRQDFISAEQWQQLVEIKDYERTHRVLDRDMFQEAEYDKQERELTFKRAFQCKEDCTIANYYGASFISMNFPVVHELHMRMEVGPSILCRNISREAPGIHKTKFMMTKDLLSAVETPNANSFLCEGQIVNLNDFDDWTQDELADCTAEGTADEIVTVYEPPVTKTKKQERDQESEVDEDEALKMMSPQSHDEDAEKAASSNEDGEKQHCDRKVFKELQQQTTTTTKSGGGWVLEVEEDEDDDDDDDYSSAATAEGDNKENE